MRNIMNLVNLSFNNFLSIKKTALLAIISFGCASLVNVSFLSILCGLITYTVAYQTMAYEDVYGIDYMISHLPVTKNQYIISRYVYSILVNIVAILLTSTIYFIGTMTTLLDLNGIDYKMILYLGIISMVILTSILIPVTLYFGTKKGRLINIIIYVLIFMFCYSSIGNAKLSVILSEINLDFILLVVSVFMIVISYLITCVLYKKKELI